MPRTKHILIGAALIGAGALTPTAAHAANTLDTVSVPTQVAAYDGTAMWSQYDAANNAYRLMESVDGATATAAPVDESPTPFDVDLGSNAAGDTVAVYSRDGDIYSLDPQTGEETDLQVSSPDDDEDSPTVSNGRVAFIRHHGGPQVRLGTLGGRSTKLVTDGYDIESIELGKKQMAIVREVETDSDNTGLRVHIRNLRTGRDAIVYRANSGGANSAFVSKPSFTEGGTAFVWARSNVGSGAGNRIVKYTLRTGALSYAPSRTNVVSSAWIDAARGVITSSSLDGTLGTGSSDDDDTETAPSPGANCADGGTQYCTVQVSGPLSFNANP